MPTPVFYATAASTTTVTTIAGTPKDSSTSFLTFYSNLQNGSYALTGTDAALFGYSNVYDSTNRRDQIVLNLSSAADHRTKSSYSFNVVATSGTLTSTIAVTGTISVANATLTPTVSLTKQTIADGDKANVTQVVANDSSTFSLVSGYTDNSSFTIDSTTGYLSLNTYASSNSKSSYSIKVTATSGYLTSTKYTDEIFTITVTDGSATFLASDNGSKQTSNYAFTVADKATVLSGSIYVTDECLFTLSGADSALFSITPTTLGTRGKTATLSLITAAKYQDKSSYSVTVTATDAASKTSTKEVGVTVVSDTTAPTVTLAAASNDVTKTVGENKFTIADTFDFTNAIITILTDELCDVTVTGTELTIGADGSVKLKSAIAKNTNTSYTFNIVATDKNGTSNTTTTEVTLVVSDKSVPVISLSTATSALQDTHTSSNLIPMSFTSDEELSTAFTADVFTPANCTINTGGTYSTTSASFNVVPTADGTVTVKLEQSKVTGKNSAMNPASDASVSFTYDSFAPTKPSITGDNPLTKAQGYIYTDVPPAITDGSTLSTYNPVDTTIVGEYYVTYTVKDTADNTSGAVRKVIVTSTGARPKPVIEHSSTPSSSYAIGDASISLFATKAIVNSVGASITVTQSVKQSDETTASSFNEMLTRAGKYFVTSSGTDDVYGILTSLVTTVTINPAITGITTSPILANGATPALSDFGSPVASYNGVSLTIGLTTDMTSNTTAKAYTATFTVTGDFGTVTDTKSFIIKPVMESLISTSPSLASGATPALADFSTPYVTYNGSKIYAELSVARATTGTYIAGTWTATLTASDDFGSVTATKTFYIKPEFTFTGGTSTWSNLATYAQNKTVTIEFDGAAVSYTYVTPDITSNGTKTIPFTSAAGAWGAAVTGSTTITVVDSNDPNAETTDATGSVAFKLSALTGSTTLVTVMVNSASGSITDTVMDNMPEVQLTMSASKWNEIFYIKPDGLENETSLSLFNAFTSQVIAFRTNFEKMPTLADLSTTDITVNIKDRTDSNVTNGNMVEISEAQNIAEATVKNWAYDLLAKENLSDMFNVDALESEINTFLRGSTPTSLYGLLKDVIKAADAKNNTVTASTNLTRQLMLQLHQAIYGGVNYTRLTNSGIFLPANKNTEEYQGFYPFTFLAGDSLTLSMSIKCLTALVAGSTTDTTFASQATTGFDVRVKIIMA